MKTVRQVLRKAFGAKLSQRYRMNERKENDVT